MTTTVYFATNRTVNQPQDRPGSYTFNIVPPMDPQAVTYATAFVDSANLTADTVGAIRSIQDISQGGFSQGAIDDLSAGGRNILVFIHGFANSFENAITRAAFNREWLAESGVADADTTVVAFSWPSRGQVITPPFPSFAYRWDQTTAGQSGIHLMSFFANLLPILQAARANGRRTFLLAHSMGNWALQAAVESWFTHGNGPADLFDEALLAAPDEISTTFEFGPFGRLSSLKGLARRISIFHNRGDKVLDILSETLNGSHRLGQDGPRNPGDIGQFPPATYRMVDCSGFNDYVADFQGSHQYYRRSAGVRDVISTVMST
jgi:esterase/lipase superfamily enzyme